MKKSDEALALAEKIASKKEHFLDRISSEFWPLFGPYADFLGPDDGREHRVIALLFYAAILKDEGK